MYFSNNKVLNHDKQNSNEKDEKVVRFFSVFPFKNIGRYYITIVTIIIIIIG